MLLKYADFPENEDVKVLQINFEVTDHQDFFKKKLSAIDK